MSTSEAVLTDDGRLHQPAVTVAASQSPVQRLVFGRTAPLVVTAGAIVIGVAIGRSVTLGVACALAAVLGGAVLYRPAAGAIALAALAPILPGLRRDLPVPGFRLSEILIVGVSVAILLAASQHERRPWRRFDTAAIVYVAMTMLLGGINVVNRGEPFSTEILGELGSPLQFFLLYRAMVVALRTPAERRTAIAVALAASVVASVAALLQQLDLGPTRDVIVELTDSDALTSWGYRNLPRASGVFAAWHSLAGYLFVVILLTGALIFDHRQRAISTRWLWVIGGAAAVALVATLTMVAVIGVAVGLLVLGAWYRSLGRVLAIAGAAALVAALLFGPSIEKRVAAQFNPEAETTVIVEDRSLLPRTINNRIGIWTHQYLPALEGRYAIGYGPGIPPEVSWQYTESLYITLLLRGGIPLLAAYGFMVIILLMDLARAVRQRDPTDRALARCLTVVLVLLVPMHLIHPYFTDAGLPQLLWLLIGVAYASSGVRREVELPEGAR